MRRDQRKLEVGVPYKFTWSGKSRLLMLSPEEKLFQWPTIEYNHEGVRHYTYYNNIHTKAYTAVSMEEWMLTVMKGYYVEDSSE